MSEESLPPDDLDLGIEAGFGRPRPESLLDSIAPGAPRVHLREPSSDDPSPVVRPVPSGNEGRYQVLGEIGRGGVGVVFKGHDVDLGRAVAIKVLRPEYADDAGIVQRFVEEAQVGGQLQHPGIVPVYKMGLRDDGKTPWFAMKLVKGRTLSALLSDRASPADDRRRLLGLFEHVCQTVAYAHSRGVVHRDLKPANVMVGAFGEVQVVDWGLAKVLARHDSEADPVAAQPERSIIATVRSGSTDSHSIVGSVFGTPGYMPPEQARGTVDDVDERSDVFALGAVLCEILTGNPAYVGDAGRLVLMAAHADLAGAYARLAACGADREIVELAETCLVASREARPRDAGELAAGVARYLASEEQKTQAAQLAAVESKAAAARALSEAKSATERAERAREQRRLTAAVAVAAVAAFAVTGGAWIWVDRDRDARVAEASRDVEAALAQSEFLRGRAAGRADSGAAHDALDTAERAEHIASTREVGPEVRKRAAESLEKTRIESARAHRIATMLRRAYRGGGVDPVETLRKATALFPDCAEAHHRLALGLGYVLQQRLDYPEYARDLAEVRSEYEKAIELDPDDTESRADFVTFLSRGYLDLDALAVQDEALIRLDPLEPAWRVSAFEHAMQRGDLDEADRVAAATKDLDPDEVDLVARLAKARRALTAAEEALRGVPLPDEWKAKPWELIEALMSTRRYATIARLWKSPELGLVETNDSDLHGLEALRIAALRAGLGEGTDARGTTDADRALFRGLSLEGYRQYLLGVRGRGRSSGVALPTLARLFTLERSVGSQYPNRPGGFTEPALAAMLPAGEREDWHAYYAEVGRLQADPRGVQNVWFATFTVGSARPVLLRRDAGVRAYRDALDQMETASATLSDDLAVSGLLGIAQYRVGDFARAVETLSRSDAAHVASAEGAQPSDVAFLALALHRLGRREEASAEMTRLRTLMSRSPHRDDAVAQRLFAEATEGVGLPTDGTK